MAIESTSQPVVRRRPRDRRGAIVRAAAEQFRSVGYHNVSMADIAASVGTGASALYHHFGGKQDLLRAAVNDAVDGLEAALEGLTQLDGMLEALSAAGHERRVTAVLWQREARHLEGADRDLARTRARRLAARLEAAIEAECPQLGSADADLRAWAVLSLLGSPAQHEIPLSPALSGLLLTAASRAARLPVPAGLEREREVGPPRSSLAGDRRLMPASRREAVLSAAIDLISAQGYQFVSLADIGAAAGIAGPSVYNHFESKSEILLAAMSRGFESLFLDLDHALAAAGTPAEALDLLLAAHVRTTVRQPRLISVLSTELINLPETGAEPVLVRHTHYVNEWIALLRGTRPELSEHEAAVLSHAVLTMCSELSRTPHLHAHPWFAVTLRDLAEAVLAVPRTVADTERTPLS